MKYLFTVMIFISILNFDCRAESAEKAGGPVPAEHSPEERFIIRIPGKEEIPAPVETNPEEDIEPTEAMQPPEKEKNSQEETKIEPLPTVDEKEPVSQDKTFSPEIPKDDLPQDEKNKDEEETVITPTRTKQLLKNVGSSISIITQKDIESSKAPLLLDVLRQVPGLEVTRTQGIGGTTSLFIRGASAAQTLVFVDGVQMNSPTTGAFNFANLTTDNIERVEILRGPQSTLYGSEEIGRAHV